MNQKPQSSMLQSLGLECFYSLMGAVDDTIPFPSDELCPNPLSEGVRSTVIATVLSLVTPNDGVNLENIVSGIKCVVDYYNLQMTKKLKL